VRQIRSTALITVPPMSTAGLESLRIPPTEWPRIGMVNAVGNQDGCRGAQLVLGYSAFGSLGT
jgi:hypothetical protein